MHQNAFLWLALFFFVVLVLVSIKYAGMKPYRVLRNDKEERFPRSSQSRAEWYENAIALEKEIYGESYQRKAFSRAYRVRMSPTCRTAMTANEADCSSFRDCSRL